MRWDRLGETTWIARDLDGQEPWRVADALRQLEIPGVLGVFPAIDTVGVEASPDVQLPTSVEVSSLSREVRVHRVPTCFEPEVAPDLVPSAAALGLSVEEFVGYLLSAKFVVICVGFSPGFPYLGGLPPALQGLPRKPSPRPSVEAGSFAITGSQAGLYRGGTPGGWNLVGRTWYGIADAQPERTFRAGDEVVLVRTSLSEWEAEA